MRKVAIIGAGAAGVVCAICACNKNREVILFDKNPYVGKKILATGNGRCNYWYSDQLLVHYHSNNEELLPDIITEKLEKEVLSFFDLLGVVPIIKNGYYYPYSNQASSIRDLLEEEARRRGVIFSFNTEVLDVFREKEQFVILTKDGSEYFDDLVIATGSKASPKTGSTGDGYRFACQFGHHLAPVRPALVQLVSNRKFLKKWAGVRTSCSVSLYSDGCFIRKEEGEIQLTDYGVSGICVFNLSRFATQFLMQKKAVELKINFLPFLDGLSEDEQMRWFIERSRKISFGTIVHFLEGILPYKLISVLLDCAFISSRDTWFGLSVEKQRKLISLILQFPLPICASKDYSSAQVCSGGVLLSEVSSCLESKIVPRLYFVGEVLDVDGDCGGYNLGFAWMSGLLVGKVIGGLENDSDATN